MSTERWSYHNPVRIRFEAGALDSLEAHLPYERAVLVTSPGFRRRGWVARIEQALASRLAAVLDDVEPNPDLRHVDAQGTRLRACAPDAIIALGGGSSMDSAKGLARLLAQPPDRTLTAHFRDGQAFEDAPALPIVAIPTTAGTGAEVTPFGTIWDFGRGQKHSVSGADLYSAQAILDPALTLGLPWPVTLASGLDAISHALESAWNRDASPVTLGLVAKSLQLSLEALPRLEHDSEDLETRGRMMQASLLAGLAISQTRTALAHSISYPLTTQYGLPHGLACSFTLPAVMRFNAGVDDGRLAHLARAVGYANIAAFADGLAALYERLDVGGALARHLPDREAAMALVDDMINPARAGNNLRDASLDEVRGIVRASLQSLGVN